MASNGEESSTATGSDTWRPLAVSCNMRKAAGEVNRQCLRLPRRAVPETCRMALDFGGSLAKIAYIVTGKEEEEENEAQVHLLTFDLEQLDSCLSYIQDTLASHDIGQYTVKATGVGCMKYRDKILDALGISVTRDDREMDHLLAGLSALWKYMDKEDLVHPGSDATGLHFRRSIRDSNVGPFLLVNLGSAMTIILVDKEGQMQGIVGGSTFGGLSFLGLGALLTKARNFKDLVELAEEGDHCNVDLMVRDTAGSSSTYNNVSPDAMVSSFGKAAKSTGSSVKSGFREADIASSILYAVTDNLAVQTYLVAQSQQVNRVCFCGTYLSGNSSVVSQITDKFESMMGFLKYDVKPLFTRHEGYLGVIGLLFDDKETPTTNGDHN